MAALTVSAAVVGYVAIQYATRTTAPGCVVRASADGDGPRYELTTEMASNAATISAVGTTRGLPERAVTIALATALQESTLRNIDHGDRDSLGLFQQRPSKGWGTPAQIMDPVYSAGKFYDGLVEVPGYSRLPLTVAAQKVQRSGFPQAYAKHEPNAALLAAALTGRTDAALVCTPGSGVEEAGDPAKVRAELVRAFGPGVLPETAGAPAAGKAPSRTEIAVPVPAPVTGTAARRGWELAHWAVARAEVLGIEQVSYGNRVWKSDQPVKGWSTRSGADTMATAGATVNGTRTPLGEVRIRLAR
jgi:hypothetical protein